VRNPDCLRISVTTSPIAHLHRARSRFRFPAFRDRYHDEDAVLHWPTPGPPQSHHQFPRADLFEHAASHPRSGHQPALGRGRGVRDTSPASLSDLGSRESGFLSCRYLIGCDGARSVGPPFYRRRAFAALRGGSLGCSDLYPRPRPDRSAAPRALLGHRRIHPAAGWSIRSTAAALGWCIITEASKGDFDSVIRRLHPTILGAWRTSVQILSKEDWMGPLIAKNSDRCAFIAGDAALSGCPMPLCMKAACRTHEPVLSAGSRLNGGRHQAFSTPMSLSAGRSPSGSRDLRCRCRAEIRPARRGGR